MVSSGMKDMYTPSPGQLEQNCPMLSGLARLEQGAGQGCR